MIPGPEAFTDIEFRPIENQAPGPNGEITIARVNFAYANHVWCSDAPVIAKLRGDGWFVGLPGGRGRGLAWSPAFGRHLAEAVRRVAVAASGDPDWPKATITRIRANHPDLRPARAMPSDAATPWRNPSPIAENNRGL